ncbi:MAG: sulfatase-like hydrolase/transferase, partial [Chloroflexi bacterium]|nr:sulfatase-like hydrolase/transferase [Chloroflexota bacterium]
LTSLYPPTHQARSYTDILPDDVVTLPEVLAVHDYHTVGFVTNYNLFPRFNFQQGFQDYYALDGVVSTWNRDGQKYYQEAELFNQSVLAWLEANHDQRFFMYLHYMDTHRPYWLHPYDGRSYYDEDPALLGPISDAYDGEIRYFDQQFGNLVAALKRLGLYDDALIILTSDHGEEFLEHDGWAHGKTLYQEVTNIPLIIKYPGGAGAGMTDAGMARSVDIATTILDVAGIPAPSIMEGVSLRQPPDAPARSQLSLSTTCQKGWSMAVRDSRYKLIEIIDGNPRGRAMTQLYDLVADPGETVNLAETHPDVLARLRATLSQMMALSEQAAVGSQEAVLDAEFQERLHQLGY